MKSNRLVPVTAGLYQPNLLRWSCCLLCQDSRLDYQYQSVPMNGSRPVHSSPRVHDEVQPPCDIHHWFLGLSQSDLRWSCYLLSRYNRLDFKVLFPWLLKTSSHYYTFVSMMKSTTLYLVLSWFILTEPEMNLFFAVSRQWTWSPSAVSCPWVSEGLFTELQEEV